MKGLEKLKKEIFYAATVLESTLTHASLIGWFMLTVVR